VPDFDDIPYYRQIRQITIPADFRNVPIIGETWEAGNAIVDFVEYGCWPHWTVWIETLWPALGKVFWQLLLFSWDDVARGYFRPTNTRGLGRKNRVPIRGSKNRAGRAGRALARKGIPEIGEEIGKKLPGRRLLEGRKITGAERWFWVIDGAAQRALWWWLVADISSGFVVNWTSAIMESEACQKPDPGTVRARKVNPQNVAVDTWSGILAWTTDTDTTDGLWTESTGQLTVPAGRKVAITIYGTSSAPLAFQNDGNQIAFSANVPPGPNSVGTPWPVGANDNPKETAAVGTIEGPVVIQTMMKCYGTGLQTIQSADLMAVFID